MICLSSVNDKSSSSEDETEKKRHLSSYSLDPLRDRRPLRISIVTAKNKSSVGKKKLCKNIIKPVEEQRPLGKGSGM